MSAIQIVILVLISSVWAVFIWWTVKRLWRSPKDPKDAWFAMAVKVESVAITAVSALVLPIKIPMPPFGYWQLVGFWAVGFFPVMLWAVKFGMLIFRGFADTYESK